jgi:hypothetical protein
MVSVPVWPTGSFGSNAIQTLQLVSVVVSSAPSSAQSSAPETRVKRSEPVRFAPETVIGSVPVFVTVTSWVAAPSSTSRVNASDAGARDHAVPVPVPSRSATTLPPLTGTLASASRTPMADGSNCTWMTHSPVSAGSVVTFEQSFGSLAWTSWKSLALVPAMVGSPSTVAADSLVFVIVKSCGGVVAPAWMSCEPKSWSAGLAEMPSTASATVATMPTTAISAAANSTRRRQFARAKTKYSQIAGSRAGTCESIARPVRP